MRGSLTTAVVLAIGLLSSSKGSAQSEPRLPPQYLAIKLGLSLGGSAHIHSDPTRLREDADDPGVELSEFDRSNGLKSASPLAEVDYLFGAHPYFALGPLLGFHSWHSSAASSIGEGTSFGVDFGVILQPRLPISSSFELYVSVPISLTLSFLNEYKIWTELQHFQGAMMQGTAEEVDPAYGYGIGVLIGARYAITSGLGVLLEFGWQRYAFTHDVQFRVSTNIDSMGSGEAIDLSVATSQFRLNAGIFF